MAGKRPNGQGSLTKTKTGKWRAFVTIEDKRITKTLPTHKEAIAWMREMIHQTEQGLGYDAARTSLGDFLDKWLEVKRTRLRLASDEQYTRTVNIYLRPHLGKLKISDVNPARIQAFYDRLLVGGTGRRTVQIVHTTLRGALNHAKRLGLLVNNPAALVQPPRPEKREMSIWDETQVSAFLAHVDGDVFYRMAFSTGMRRGELLGLKWEDLNWKTGMLQVRRQVYEPQGGGWRFQEPKTSRGKRGIRLGPGLLEALREHYSVGIPLMMSLAGDDWQENDLIFPNSRGGPRNGYEVTKKFQRCAVEAGLPKIRFHDIRHTCASLLLAHREPPVRVAAMLGQSIQVLLETYAHFIPDDNETAALLMDEITTPIPVAQLLHTRSGQEI